MSAAERCVFCGAPGMPLCRCGRPSCPAHTFYQHDDANDAITRNARPECIYERPVKWPRPYTLNTALMWGEWWLDAA